MVSYKHVFCLLCNQLYNYIRRSIFGPATRSDLS